MSLLSRMFPGLRNRRTSAAQDDGHHWTMTIDLDRCTGCEACVTACQAENNLPIVGEAELARGRDMQWIRIERYWEGDFPDARLRFVPMLCQQCDSAPCEAACPVGATYSGTGGTNAQDYNRCIGAGWCASACPYEVRRFNVREPAWDEPLDRQLNPRVSVREKGVMEKCTFCVQRIQEKQDLARNESRAIRDGEIQPACAQTCPTGALVFGDRNDPESEVSKKMRDPRADFVGENLGTQPSVIYLRKMSAGRR